MHAIHYCAQKKAPPFMLTFLFFICCLFISGCGNNTGTHTQNMNSRSDSINHADRLPLNKVPAPGIGNGVNLQPSYYNNGIVNFAWPLMRTKDKIKTVRIEIEPTAAAQAKNWIRQADSAGYTIIATYHNAKELGSDDPAQLQEAARWWQQNYALLTSGLSRDSLGHFDSSRFMINLFNEWGSHKMNAANYAKAYNAAITSLRTFYKGYIIIDIPGWGQETYTAYLACKTTAPRIRDAKIVLSAHIYPNGYNQGRGHILQPSDLEDMANTGYPCILGEFGTGAGSCNWSAVVDYAKKLGWPVIGWAWNGDGAVMNMVAPSWSHEPLAPHYSTTPYFDTLYNKL